MRNRDLLPVGVGTAFHGAGLIGFGTWIVTAEARAHLLAFGIAIGIIPVVTGLLSIHDELNNGSS